MISSFKELLEYAKLSGPKRIALAGGADPVAVAALKLAVKDNLIKDPILVGEKEKIERLEIEPVCRQAGFEIVDTPAEEAPVKAAKLVKEGVASIIMKGKVTTSAFLKGILSELRTDKRLSHMAVLESPFYHKLLLMTDGGMNINPDLEVKIDILTNGIEFAHKIGIKCPKVAILAAVETVNPDMPETVDAQELAEMAQDGKFGECVVEGPLALDLAVSKEACQIKGIESKIAGDADMLIVSSVIVGNIAAKSMVYLGNCKIAGVVLGALAPVIMLSRADTQETKICSIALGIAGI